MGTSKKNKSKKLTAADPGSLSVVQEDDLVDDLFSQLDARDQELATSVPAQTADPPALHTKQDAKGRYKARQARKAVAAEQSLPVLNPDLEARLEREAREEEKDISKICEELSLQIHEVNPDGHCLFSSIADQLVLLGILSSSQASYTVVRKAASDYILSHPDDFLPFLPPPPGEDGLMSPEPFQKYCIAIRDTAEWGGEPEIRALSRTYEIPIHVVQAGRPPIVVYDPSDPSSEGTKEKDRRVVRISYHRRMYGLGEHYNSLRPRSTLSQLSLKMQTILST